MIRYLPLLVAALLVAGCTGGKQTTAEVVMGPGAQKEGQPFRVALLTPGPVSDAGWSAMAYEGLKSIEGELKAEVSHQEAESTAEIRDALRSYGQKEYNLIFGHGFEYNSPSLEIGKDFPNTAFVSSSGAESSANVATFRFHLEQGFYMAGMLAGLLSKTDTVAMIGGPDVPSIRSTFKAFKAGAEAANPKIKVIESFTGSGDDVAKAKQATLAAIGQGADFVIHQANAAAQGVFDACKEKGVYAIGSNLNQNDNPSGVVIASALINAQPAFLELAKQVRDGNFEGGVLLKGMADGVIEFKINPAHQHNIPEPVLAKLFNEVEPAVRTGEIKVPMDKF